MPSINSAYTPTLMPRPGFQGMQIFGGRSATAVALNGSGLSYEFAYELSARSVNSVASVAPIWQQSRNGATNASFQAEIQMIPALSQLDVSWSGTVPLFGGDLGVGANQIVTAPTAFRRTQCFSNMMNVDPVARSDGGVRPLAVCKTFVGNFATMLLGIAGDDLTNWATRTAGLARFRVNSTLGNQISSVSNWGLTSTGPCVGFAYSHLGPIANVMSIGDSIDEGRGTYLDASFGLVACESINALSPHTWQSHSNLAWSGQTTTQMAQNLQDIIHYGVIPDVLIFPCGSPNDMPLVSDPITTAIVNTWRANTTRILGLCAQYKIAPFIRDVLPVDHDVRQWGATDALRIAYNAEMKAWAATARVQFAAMADAFAGPLDTGQQTLLHSNDGVHPDTTGIALGASGFIQPGLVFLEGGYL